MTVTNVLVSCTAALAIAGAAFAVDSEPHMKVKVCNPAETYCANVNANLGLHSNLRDSAGAEIGVVANPLFTSGSISSTVGSYVDKGAFIYGTDKFNPTGGIYQDTLPTLSAGTVGVSRMTQYRALHVNLRDAMGVEFATIDNPLIIAPANSTGRFNQGDVTSSSVAFKNVNRTTYTEQTSNAQRSIVSASANDSASGTGARTVEIQYCTVSGVCGLSEIVTLNGITAVNTVATDICYIERIVVKTVGSTGSNVGILTLRAATGGGGAVIGTINATDNRTFWGHHYVDSGKLMNITGVSVSHNGTTVGSGGVFIVRAIPLNVANQVEQQISDFVRLYGQSSTFSRNYASPIPVVGPAKVTIYVTPETASSTVYRGAIDFFEQ
jgi:hypothetical protein